ncbi:MAG: hypothetical protein HFI49_05040 [Bacilli bacterium]|jgi:hypothetical protein|nr:hypothetical protein [Bacilli bacterium]
MKNKVNDLKIIYNKTIKVVGVTFANHPKNINKIIENGIYYKAFKRYSGYKDKELIKENINIKEFNKEELSDVILEAYKYENNDAIKVLINDFDDNYLEVGNIPADEVNNLLPYLKNKNNLILSAYLTGGNLKNIIHDEYKNYIEIEKLNIGISLDIIVKEK